MSKLNFVPSKHLEGKYEIIGTIVPILYSKIGKIDFRTITAEEAEKLVKAGTSYLVKVNKPEKKAKEEKSV